MQGQLSWQRLKMCQQVARATQPADGLPRPDTRAGAAKRPVQLPDAQVFNPIHLPAIRHDGKADVASKLRQELNATLLDPRKEHPSLR